MRRLIEPILDGEAFLIRLCQGAGDAEEGTSFVARAMKTV